MASASYAPLRDSSSHRSLSLNERNFLRSCATPSSRRGGRKVLRSDGRSPTESRPLRLTFGRSHGAAEATVQLGSGTRVVASVSCDLIPPPNLDRPNDGVVRFSVDLSPMANAAFGCSNPVSAGTGGGGGGDGDRPSGPGGAQEADQKLLSNRALRLLERTFVSGGALDAEALCVRSGRWVWRLNVDVTALDDGGNLVDALALGAAAALRHFRRPAVEVRDEDGGQPTIWHADEREPSPLPLHHTPLCVTFALLAPESDDPGAAAPGVEAAVSALIDPTDREELVSDGTLTVCYNRHGELCGVDYPGGCELNPRQLVRCTKIGGTKCVELCEVLETALGEADERAGRERMERLRAAAAEGGRASQGSSARPDAPSDAPFVESTGDDEDMEVDSGDLGQVGEDQARAAREEEEYRLKALDYARMHQAARVKENDDKKGGKDGGGARGAGAGGPRQGSGLMSAMLKAAATSSSSVEATTTKTESRAQRPVVSSARTAEADDEFERYAAKEQADAARRGEGSEKELAAADDAAGVGDDDEEEEEEAATTLRSEFDGIGSAPGVEADGGKSSSGAAKAEEKPKKNKEKMVKASPDGMDIDGEGEDDDVDDLAAAVKKKKKKGKEKKGKKGKKK